MISINTRWPFNWGGSGSPGVLLTFLLVFDTDGGAVVFSFN